MRFAAPRSAGWLLFGLVVASPLFGDWRDSIGATRLAETFSGVPASVGVVTQVEAGLGTAGSYLPDAANYVFAGQTIVARSGPSAPSDHATVVGASFYGVNSLLSATKTIHGYSAGYWLEGDYLNYGAPVAPRIEAGRVQNHSWIATGSELTAALVEEIDQRLDFAIERDGFVAAVGVDNGFTTSLPPLFAQAYNHITVGVTTGGHSAGFTTFDGVGRIKPDIVAPDFFTSYATPKVAGAAGVLAARAGQTPHAVSGSDVPRLVKALLLAGATKEEFPAWARTTTRPLDLRYGAGRLNLFLPYRILESGRAPASTAGLAGESGWALETIADGANQTFFFEISPEAAAAPFSVVLAWHRLVADGDPGPDWSAAALPLVNLDLRLHAASEFTVGALLDQSASPVDNVEHLYSAALAPGRYALVVSAPSAAPATRYALAWRTTPSVRVVASTPVAREADGAAGVFTLTRAGSTATPLRVPFAFDGTAIPGEDYIAPPESVLIPAGAVSATVVITPIADALAKGDRTVALYLQGDYSLAAASPSDATLAILDKPYDAWRFARFSAAQLETPSASGPTADPDGDGLPNQLEYALGGEPLAADAAGLAPVVGRASDATSYWLTIAYTQPAGRTDLSYTVEWSADLAGGWQSGPTVVTELSREPVPGGERVLVRALASLQTAPRQFLRLNTTRL